MSVQDTLIPQPVPCRSNSRGVRGQSSVYIGFVSVGHKPLHASSLHDFHLVKNISDFPLLVLKGIYHYWTYFHVFPRGLNLMEDDHLNMG